LKDIELKLISELMKNCRRSDREIANTLGVSQPTVSRMIKKLERQGILRECVAIPDFGKLGYEIIAFTFVKLKSALSAELRNKAREVAMKSLKEGPFEIVMLERGLGLESDGVVVSVHRDFSSYLKLKEWLMQFDFLQISEIRSFLINLKDDVHYRPFTLSTLAKDLLIKKETK